MSSELQIVLSENDNCIVPPIELKPIINTTAQYVSKRGRSLELQIAERQKNNPKFAFLQPSNPYHDYFRKKIRDFSAKSNEKDKEKTENTPSEETPQNEKTKAPETKEIINDAVPKIKKPLLERLRMIISDHQQPSDEFVKEQREFHFDVRPSTEMVSLDVEIIKLTAMFVAANGRGFLATVSNREQKNPQFAFLKPVNAALFLYFSDMVQAYQRVISFPKEAMRNLKEEAAKEKIVFKKLLGAAEYKVQEKQRVELMQINRENEKKEMSLIDWHSFIILETIEFNDGDDEYLPPPSMTIEEINVQLEADQRLIENIEKVGAKITDEQAEKDSEAQNNQMEDENETIQTSATTLPDKIPTPPITPSAKKATARSIAYQRCKVCSQDIPVDEIQEHMRIELLDPKWREQRLIAQSKQRDNTEADADEMSSSLRRFVKVRKRPFAQPERNASGTLKFNESIKRFSAQAMESSSARASTEENQSLLAAAAREGASRPTEDALKEMTIQMKNRVEGIEPSVASKGSAYAVDRPPLVNSYPPGTAAPQPMRPMMNLPPGAGPGMGAIRPSQPQQPMMNLPPPYRPMGNQMLPQMPFRGMMQRMQMQMGYNPMRMPARMMQRPPMAQMAPGFIRPAESNSSIRGQERNFSRNGSADGLNAANQKGFHSEEKFLRIHAKNVVVNVAVPSDPTKEWNFTGQTESVPMELTQNVAELKTQLSRRLNGMSTKKMKLKIAGGNFLKDGFSLAHYNLSSKVPLELGVKARGGRK